MSASIYAKHLPYEDGHLGRVIEEMKLQGAPTIRVVQRGDDFYALEGSHRLAAAHILGIVPKFVAEEVELEDYAPERWLKVATTLPNYVFDTALLLELKNF